MKSTLRAILAVILGLIVGSFVNGALISISGNIIPPPEGADVNTMEGLKASLHLFEPKHFIMPFLAHALGTFVGALIAGLIAVTHHRRYALTIGVFFLLGGITNVFLLPAPVWFCAVDILLAYVPMALLADFLLSKRRVA